MRVRIGLVGFGGIAGLHQKYLAAGGVPNADLTAVADPDPSRLEAAKALFGDKVKRFSDAPALLDSGAVDGIIICTPHYDHPTVAIQAFQRGLHVLSEKPAGVYTRQVREMNEAAARSGRVFGIMFNQRTLPLYQKIRDLVRSGELGRIHRVQWTITNWYRTQRYYDSGGWRATWKGEGGGVLLNQCPHNLDLWQWMVGMPTRIRGFCKAGRFHRIEVEDEATIVAEYPDGATGLFVTSTGEAPGLNRLEIAGENGLLVAQDGLKFRQNRRSSIAFSDDPKSGGFAQPECWDVTIPVPARESGHAQITRNWVNAILTGEPLLAPGEDGIRSLQISNAAYLSSWLDRWITLPVDESLYEAKLQEKIASAAASAKTAAPGGALNFEGTTGP